MGRWSSRRSDAGDGAEQVGVAHLRVQRGRADVRVAQGPLCDAEVSARVDEDLRAVEVAAGVWCAADPARLSALVTA